MILRRLIIAFKIVKAHAASGIFDSVWYRQKYPQIGRTPLMHFALFGIYEGKYPAAKFNIENYLTLNPDVKAAGVHPVIHYMLNGWKEKRPLSITEKHRSLLSRVVIPKQAERGLLVPPDLNRMKITWVIPDFISGNGGHMTIFQMASHLEKKGHDVSLLILNPTYHESVAEVRKTMRQSFVKFGGKIFFCGSDLLELEGDVLIATDSHTCYPVRAMSGFRRKFYFVQDHESEFHPMGTDALLAEYTYSMGFDCLSCGEWLHRMMSERYDCWSRIWHLSHDREFYFFDPGIPRSARRIVFYARPVTTRRAVELGLMALEILARRGVDFEVDFFGWDLGKPELPYSYKSHGVLNASRLGDLYRRGALGLVFSATNHSIINKEMMACGLPVIDLDVESVRSVFPDDVLKRVKTHPEEIADAIEELLGNEQTRGGFSGAGIAYANRFSWEESGGIIEAALRERLS
jgi:glycosyltransferase involved in cell wall biosynthesis